MEQGSVITDSQCVYYFKLDSEAFPILLIYIGRHFLSKGCLLSNHNKMKIFKSYLLLLA